MMVKRTYVAGDNARCGGDEVIPGFMDKHSTGSESEPNHAVECLCTDGPAHPLVGGSGRRGSYGSDLFHIDPEESAESVGTMDSTVTSLSYGEDGTLFYLTSGRGDWLPPRYFGIMDEDTGEQFEIGEVDFTGNGSLALSGGVMYQIDRTSSVLRVIDLATADTYDISSGTLYDHYGWNLFEYATCMTASPDGMLYVVSYADLWTVDPVTAEVTSLGMLSGSSSGRHIGCTFHDGVFYTNHNEELSIIDPVAMTIESTGVRLDMSIDALAGVN